MTPPRQVLPDTPFELTQRTLARTFRFLPTPEVRQLFLYVLGVAAQRYDVTLYGLCVMATHYHLAGRDNGANLPMFAQYLNSLLARALNAVQGEDDKFWSGSGYVSVVPQTPDDLLRKVVYGLANPVAAGLVNRIEDYPGLLIRPNQIGSDITVRRPAAFFRDRGSMPDSVTLRFEVPPEFRSLGRDGYRKLLWEHVRDEERRHRAERKRDGRSVVGEQRLRRARVGQRATSLEEPNTLRPTITAKTRSDRKHALSMLKNFRDAYRCARARWASGERDAEFPAGTWWLPRYAGARAAPCAVP